MQVLGNWLISTALLFPIMWLALRAYGGERSVRDRRLAALARAAMLSALVVMVLSGDDSLLTW